MTSSPPAEYRGVCNRCALAERSYQGPPCQRESQELRSDCSSVLDWLHRLRNERIARIGESVHLSIRARAALFGCARSWTVTRSYLNVGSRCRSERDRISWPDFADFCERCTLVVAFIAEKIVGTTLTPSSSSAINSGRTGSPTRTDGDSCRTRGVRARPDSGAERGHLDCSATSSSTSAPEIRFHLRSRLSSFDGCAFAACFFPAWRAARAIRWPRCAGDRLPWYYVRSSDLAAYCGASGV